jgi:hypothetical protein
MITVFYDGIKALYVPDVAPPVKLEATHKKVL